MDIRSPGEGSMRLVLISDTHEQHRRMHIPAGDILVHAGDITFNGNPAKVFDFNAWLGELLAGGRIKHAVVIAGNHDWCAYRFPDMMKDALFNAHYLQDSSVVVDGARFYGSAWTPPFGAWAFMLPPDQIREKWALIPEGTDVLVTHGPPYGILDKTERGDLAGCRELMLRVRKVKPRLHVAGHIHEAYGMYPPVVGYDGQPETNTTFVNASSCNLTYHPINPPIVIDLDD